MSTNSDLDPTDIPDLRNRATKDPDNETAREVDDPHEWTDDGPSIRERLVPDTAGQWIGMAATGLVVLGLVWYLAPIFGNVVTNPLVIAGLIFLAYTTGVYIKGRSDGISVFTRLEKSIIYYGDDADVRLCQDAGVDGRSQLVSPIKNLSIGGLRSTPLTLADLPWQADRLKSKLSGHSNPDEQPVRDRLNASTVTVPTDTMGTVHVTHAADLDYDDYGRHSDRYAEPPHVIDEAVAEDFRKQHAELHSQYKQLQDQLNLLKQANEDMQSLRDSQTIPQFEQMMDSFEDLLQMVNTHNSTNNQERRRRRRRPLDEQ